MGGIAGLGLHAAHVAIDRDGNRVTKSVPYVVDPAGGGSGPGGGNGPGAGAAAGAGLAASPSALKRLRRKATATLSFRAPAGSRVSVRVTRGAVTLAKAAGRAAGNGAVRLTLRPAGAAARRLLRGHAKLRLRVAVTVTDPQGRVGRKAKTLSVRR